MRLRTSGTGLAFPPVNPVTALHGASPSGVDVREDAMLRIDERHRKTVGDFDAERDAALGGPERVARVTLTPSALGGGTLHGRAVHLRTRGECGLEQEACGDDGGNLALDVVVQPAMKVARRIEKPEAGRQRVRNDNATEW